ncbi:hypothetical protein [Thermococcus sp. 21S7]|uniref:hypothetical protein n=1 Tax=Thermococcus sp. 21S7 TaxID=1638221 RepID=UPI00143C8A26|nr:hypothetical protein [Thermococcus sp. 21S7]NJE60970.1 hypothetical protein [Thermococcus sp. 21S7]
MSETITHSGEVTRLMAESIAKKIGEKPEDVIWFFELRSLIEASRSGRLDKAEIIRKPAGIDLPLHRLLTAGKKNLEKYRRIEEELRKAGLV